MSTKLTDLPVRELMESLAATERVAGAHSQSAAILRRALAEVQLRELRRARPKERKAVARE